MENEGQEKRGEGEDSAGEEHRLVKRKEKEKGRRELDTYSQRWVE